MTAPTVLDYDEVLERFDPVLGSRCTSS